MRLQRMRGEVRQDARPVQTGRRRLLLAVLKSLQAPGRYQRLCGEGAGGRAVGARWPMRRHPYDATAGVDETGTGGEQPEGGEEIGRRGAVNGRGRVGAGVRRAVVVVLLRQLLFDVVAPGSPAVVQKTGRSRLAVVVVVVVGIVVVVVVVIVVVVVVALLPGPLSFLVAVRLLRGRALRVLHPALAQQTAYAERMAARRVVRQRPRAGLAGRRRAGTLVLRHVAAVVARVIPRTAASRVRVVHVDLLRRVHVAVAVL